MRIKILITQATLAAVALLFSSAALASLAPTDCSATPGAIANGDHPTSCAIGTLGDNSIGTETDAINEMFQGTGDPLFFVGKYDKELGPDGTLPGFTLTAGAETEADWDYFFSLVSSYSGMVDFALLVKQPDENSPPVDKYVAYYWSGLTLDIDGFYNSFKDDYSHVSAFIRGVDVSEPAPLALLGLGLVGIALLRRRPA